MWKRETYVTFWRMSEKSICLNNRESSLLYSVSVFRAPPSEISFWSFANTYKNFFFFTTWQYYIWDSTFWFLVTYSLSWMFLDINSFTFLNYTRSDYDDVLWFSSEIYLKTQNFCSNIECLKNNFKTDDQVI